jgi:hypothetical protein
MRHVHFERSSLRIAQRHAVKIADELSYPRPNPLDPLAIRSKALESLFRRAPASTLTSVARVHQRVVEDGELIAHFPGLVDELGCYMNEQPPVDEAAYLSKSAQELGVFGELAADRAELQRAARSDFTGLLFRCHSSFGIAENRYRRTTCHIVPDELGNCVEFPDWKQCELLIGALSHFVRANLDAHPALTAMVAYGAIVHAHPFEDGNGRTARTIYHLIMSAGTGSRHFVPIARLSALRHGSFLIKMRRALYGADWDAFHSFFLEAARISAQLQSPASEPSRRCLS